MINVSTHPSLTQLHELIDDINAYPVSAGQVTRLAHRRNFPNEIVGFYGAFRPDQLFFSKDDLLSQTEAVELMQTEPQPYEDIVHGAED